MKNKLIIKLEFSVLLYLIIDKNIIASIYIIIVFSEIYLYNNKKKDRGCVGVL